MPNRHTPNISYGQGICWDLRFLFMQISQLKPDVVSSRPSPFRSLLCYYLARFLRCSRDLQGLELRLQAVRRWELKELSIARTSPP